MTKKLTIAQQKLVVEHAQIPERLARSHSKWHSAFKPQVDDLTAVGKLELCEAARVWDRTKGPFVPYAIRRIRWAFELEDLKTANPVHVPRDVQKIMKQLSRAKDNGALTVRELSAVTGFTPKRIQEILPYLEPGHHNIETVPEPAHSDVTEDLVEDSFEKIAVRKSLDVLNPQERKVIEARFGFTTGAPMTTHEIAKRFRMNVETVQRLEAAAAPKLREQLEGLE